MDIIEECFDENGKAFIERLENAGFSKEQAQRFLPEATSGILEAAENTGIEKTISGIFRVGTAQLLTSINVEKIAHNLGINREKASAGLDTISPCFSEMIEGKNGGTVGTAASLIWNSSGNLTNLASKWYSRKINN